VKYNRLELLLITEEFYNADYQPLKDMGIYAVESTKFCVYGKRWSTKSIIELLKDVIHHRVNVLPKDDFYGDVPYDFFEKYTIGRDYISFDFIFIPRGEEHLYLEYADKCKVITLATLENKKVLSVAETKKIVLESDEDRRVSILASIATWKPNPNSFFNDFDTTLFADKHYPQCYTALEVNRRFKELSKTHHPDKGGEEIMFKALSSTKEFLKGVGVRTKPLKLTV